MQVLQPTYTYGPCTATCGLATRTQRTTYKILTQPQNGGKACTPTSTSKVSCNLGGCSGSNQLANPFLLFLFQLTVCKPVCLLTVTAPVVGHVARLVLRLRQRVGQCIQSQKMVGNYVKEMKSLEFLATESLAQVQY